MAFGDLAKAELARDLSDRALMRRTAIGVHEDDRDRVKTLRPRFAERRAHGRGVGRDLNRSVGEHALVDLDHARVEKLGLLDRAGEDLRARLIADFERVAKPARRNEERALALPLE